MTPKQESYYWRTWAGLCRAMGWKSSDTARRHALAAFACASANRMPDLEPARVREQIINEGTCDLPPGCSHTFFGDAEFDQFLTACKLITHGTSIDAIRDIMDPPGERARLHHAIYALIQDYGELDAFEILRGRFRGLDWMSLPTNELRHLRFTLTARVYSRKKKLAVA